MADQSIMDNGLWLSLGAVALLGVAGLARNRMAGDAGGGFAGMLGGSAGRMSPALAGRDLEIESDPEAGSALANWRWHGDAVYPPTKPRGTSRGKGKGSKSQGSAISQILNVYKYKGKNRTTWRKKLGQLSATELQHVHTAVMQG